MLTGEGSDETLAGYGRYRKTILEHARWGGAYQSATTGVRCARSCGSGLEALPRVADAAARCCAPSSRRPATLETLYFDNFAVFSREQQASPARAGAARAPGQRSIPYAAARCRSWPSSDAQSLLDRLLYVDTKTYLHELLMKQDQMSMAASIESRVPFLDHPLVEFTATLPERLKLRGGTTKYILREAMRDVLPPEILSRGKMGFPVPIGTLAARALPRDRRRVGAVGARAASARLFDPAASARWCNEHQAGEDHTERLWSLVNVEIWHRIVMDGEPAESLRLDLTPGLPTLCTSSGSRRELLHPLDKGGRIRTYEMLRRLQRSSSRHVPRRSTTARPPPSSAPSGRTSTATTSCSCRSPCAAARLAPRFWRSCATSSRRCRSRWRRIDPRR